MSGRPTPPDDVYFPVVPMLDMAFQLLAFFILTFQAPGQESRIDLDLPAAPVALPGGASQTADRAGPPDEDERTADLTVRAEADPQGRLRSLRLGGTSLPGADALAAHLRDYVLDRPGQPLTVALIADDALLYDEAAKLLGACGAAEVAAVRLVPAPARRSTEPAEDGP